MKFLIAVLTLCASLTAGYAQSCCCTGAGANYSILPNLDKHIIGLRYTHRNYYSETYSLNPELNGQVTNQYMNSLELFGRFNVAKRLQLSTFMPVNFVLQKSATGNEHAAGLGDMSFLLQYNVFNPALCNGKKYKQQLRLGIGTKLPSGQFVMNKDDLFSTNLQLGTGSIDFLFNAVYTYRYNSFGLNTTAAYKLNTVNNKSYRFGDKIQAGANFFYVFDVKDFQLMPMAGINYEHQASNKKEGRLLDYTGGDYLTTPVGFDIYYKQFAFSSTVSPAIMNRLNWTGENKNKFNIEVGVFYIFSTKTKS